MKRTLLAELIRDAAIALVTWCGIFMPLAEIMAIRERNQEQSNKSASARRAAAAMETCLKDKERTDAAGDCLRVLPAGDPSVNSADWTFHHAFHLFTVTAAMPATVKPPKPRAAPGEKGVAPEIVNWLAGKSTQSESAAACNEGSTGFELCRVFAEQRVRKAVAMRPDPVRRRLEDAGPAIYAAFTDASQHKSLRTWIALSMGVTRAQLESETVALKAVVEEAYLTQFYQPPKGLPKPSAAFKDAAGRVFAAPFGTIFWNSLAFLTGAAVGVLALVYLYVAWEVREQGGRRLLFFLALPTFSIAAVIRAAVIGMQQWIDQGNPGAISPGKAVLGLLDSHDHPYVAFVLALFCAVVASGISFDLAQFMSMVARREGRQPHTIALRTLGFHHGEARTPVVVLAYFGRVFVELFSRRHGRFSSGCLERDILPFQLRGTEYNSFEVLRRRLPQLADCLIITGVLFGLPNTAADLFLRAIRFEDITLLLQGGTVVLLCGLFLRSIAAVVYFRLFGSSSSRSAMERQGGGVEAASMVAATTDGGTRIIHEVGTSQAVVEAPTAVAPHLSSSLFPAMHEQPETRDADETPAQETTTPTGKTGGPDWGAPQGGGDRGGERNK